MMTFKKISILRFFTLTLIYTLPTYVLVALTGMNIILSEEMVFAWIPLAVLAPISAAITLTYKESGWAGTKKLLKRGFDIKRIKEKKWLLLAITILPIIFVIQWIGSSLLDWTLPPAGVDLFAIPVLLIVFFMAAFAENIGWMGYAFEPMETKWGTLKASLLLGLFWGLWHVPMYVFAIDDPSWVVAQAFSLIGLRILIIWLFIKTGRSVFIAILIHAIYNVCMAVFPVNLIGVSILISIAAIIVLVYGFKPKRKA